MRNGLQWSQERENNQKIVVVHTMACFNAFSFSKKEVGQWMFIPLANFL
ncbi:hypothetical protein PORCAN_1677 [Porphyromonas crevioricanis JCM 13913]|nr:hypothetical protein PORCAN_1677 [Porphyromonas crevioricanis JCM 13913]